ncbi:MAG: hypothetical protein Q7J68_06560 [Thermoplasmata archaeon]|nr:hypothetical protein [Thermoplasmata archaeon]
MSSEAQASAPGRLVLFGEHAVNLGQPGVALAVDFRVKCTAQLSSRFTVNGEDLEQAKHPNVRGAVIQGWTDMDRPIGLTLDSAIPPELGLCNESATTVACLGAISMLHDHLIFEQVGKGAFEARRDIDQGCTPLDTSCITHGSSIFLDSQERDNLLWSIDNGQKKWYLHDVEIPEMNLVLGFSSVPPQVDMRTKIMRFHERNSFARDIVKDIGKVTREGYEALMKKDLVLVGEIMNKNNRLLVNLGASTPALEKMVMAAARHSYGVKITGTNGNCIVALARNPEEVIKAIESAGGKAFIIQLANEGVRPED